MAINDIFYLEVQYAIESRELRNTFGYRMTAGTDVSDLAQILSNNYWIGTQVAWQDIAAVDVSFQCIVVYRVAPSPMIPNEQTLAPILGLDPGEALPANSSIVAKFITDATDPRNNGRKYLSLISELRLLDGQLEQTFMATKLNTWSIAHANDVVAAGPDDQTFEPVVINRVDNKVPVVPPQAFHVTSVVNTGVIQRQSNRTTKRTSLSV